MPSLWRRSLSIWPARSRRRREALVDASNKRHINPTRVPIKAKESICWLENMPTPTALLGDAEPLVHISDRENDIYEFFCAARDVGRQVPNLKQFEQAAITVPHRV